MIETTLKWVAVFVGCLILQTTLIPVLAVYGVQPDLIIVALFFLCLKYGVLPGIYTGFLLGLSLDLYSPLMLGQHALAKTVIGFFMGLFNEKMMKIDPVVKVIILAVGFIIHDVLFSGAELLKHGNSLVTLFPELFTNTLPRTVYTILVIFIIQFWNNTIKPNLKR